MCYFFFLDIFWLQASSLAEDRQTRLYNTKDRYNTKDHTILGWLVIPYATDGPVAIQTCKFPARYGVLRMGPGGVGVFLYSERQEFSLAVGTICKA